MPVKNRPPAKRGKYWKKWIEKDLATGAWRTACNLYVNLILRDGWPLTEEQLDQIGRIYRPKDAIPAATFKSRLLHVDRGRRPFLEDTIKAMAEQASNVGGRDYLEEQMKLLNRAIDKAQESDDIKEIVKVVNEIDKYTGKTLKEKLKTEAAFREADRKLPESRGFKLLAEINRELDEEDG